MFQMGKGEDFKNLHRYLLKYRHYYLLKYRHCYLPFTEQCRDTLKLLFHQGYRSHQDILHLCQSRSDF